MTGPFVCPKCKNTITIAYGKNNAIECLAKIFLSIEKDEKNIGTFRLLIIF